MQLITQNILTGEIKEVFKTKEDFLRDYSLKALSNDRTNAVIRSSLDDLINGDTFQLHILFEDKLGNYQHVPTFAVPSMNLQSKKIITLAIRQDLSVDISEQIMSEALNASNLIYAIGELEHGATTH